MKNGVIILVVGVLLLGNFLVLQGQEDVSALIQKLDSDKIAERNEAYDKLLELARKDKSVFEVLKKEVDSPSKSFNAKYMLKKILNEVENGQTNQEARGQDRDKKVEIAPIGKITTTIKPITITFSNKPTIGIKGISVNDSKILDVLKSDFNTKYADMGEFLKSVGLDSAKGVFILEVVKNSPADNVLQVGDILLKIDNHDIKDMDSLKNILETSYKVGQSVKLQVLRNKIIKEIELKLASEDDINKKIAEVFSNIQKEMENLDKIIKVTPNSDEDKFNKKLEEIEKKVTGIEDNVKNILEKLNDIQQKLNKLEESKK